jgi:uncharacterized protein with PhoU and TrkA domain
VGNGAAFWQALQGVGMLGLVIVAIIAISRGAYIPRAGHEEVIAQQALLIAQLSRDVDRLHAQVERLESALAAKSGDDD